jgi:hypothetical protein
MRARSSLLMDASISLMSATWTARSAWSRPSAATPYWAPSRCAPPSIAPGPAAAS